VIATLCTALSAAAFFGSIDLGDLWPLAWLAPLPILWLAFGRARTLTVAFAAFAAYAIGSSNILEAYVGFLPAPVLIIAICAPAVLFTLSVLAARMVAARVDPLAGVLAFAALWTALGYLASFGPDGTAANVAYSQVPAPILIQSASLFGLWSIAFLIAFVPASIALALRRRKVLPAALGIGLFALNAAYGAYVLAQPAGPALRVGLIDSDKLGSAAFADDGAVALATIDAYDNQALTLARDDVRLVVYPEKLAIMEEPWRTQAAAKLAATARTLNATLVAGFDNRDGATRENIAWVFPADGGAPQIYSKRHMVPGLESAFTPGNGPLTLSNRVGIEICKDMDFNRMVRQDSRAHADVMAVPAWDFDADAYLHGDMAVMRDVENGFALARSARDGLLTLSDAQGRILALRRTSYDGFATLVDDLPRGTNAGNTLYDRIGDAFAWLCIAVSTALLLLGFFPRKKAA
jgi:apolipoprotein N-acyltransferase